MSLDTVVEDIRDEARARAEKIQEEGQRQADEIVTEAEADADEIVAEAEREVKRTVEQEREQSLSSAKLEAKQQRLEARRDVLERVREGVEAELTALEGEKREELTRELLAIASEEFEDSESVAVYGRADDQALIESILADIEGYSYAGEYDCLGGIVVESEESRVRVNNTFDSILEDVWEDSLKDISDSLFEQ